jgi:hypothetical protein
MATPHETAEKCADRVLQVIERNRRIVKADIVEAIAGVLAVQVAASAAPIPTFARDAIDRMTITSLSMQHLNQQLKPEYPGQLMGVGWEYFGERHCGND